MALTTMYEGKNNSPQTDITSAISAADAIIPVTDVSVFPAAPNLATIGNDENAEVIRYNGIEGSMLTGCERGFGGTSAKQWEASTVISRQITKYDLDTLADNIRDLDNRKLESVGWGDITGPLSDQTDLNTALAAKAPLASPALTGNPTAPTQSTGDNSTKLATTAFVQAHAPITLSVTASAGTTVTKSDSRITSTMRLISYSYSHPYNVASTLTWATGAGFITFSGTFTGAVTITFDLVETN